MKAKVFPSWTLKIQVLLRVIMSVSFVFECHFLSISLPVLMSICLFLSLFHSLFVFSSMSISVSLSFLSLSVFVYLCISTCLSLYLFLTLFFYFNIWSLNIRILLVPILVSQWCLPLTLLPLCCWNVSIGWSDDLLTMLKYNYLCFEIFGPWQTIIMSFIQINASFI